MTSSRLLTAFLLLAASRSGAQGPAPVRYIVDIREPALSVVRVTMEVPGAPPQTQIQIPTWNNLYQFRDFARNVQDLEARCDGQAANAARVDLNTWQGPERACADLAFRYTVYVHESGPFSSELNSTHAFLNFAMLLFYLPRERARPVHVKILLPGGWSFATLLPAERDEFSAPNYDALIDSPVEAGHYREYSFTQLFRSPQSPFAALEKSATIRVIVHADPADYSGEQLLETIRKIVATETALMQDLPFDRYTFILHFPKEPGPSGGMEHRGGTAITLSASQARKEGGYLANVLAHEFFHAWNVKRIRPQALEPIDYIRGNDTRDLWLAEGVTSTYADLTLLRAGLIDREQFYARVASAIQTLEERDARQWQSVETSGREAWFEKYPDYNRSERSISYYNKGEILGFLLDLGMRNASRNLAGLDDLMRRLNRDFAQRSRYYTTGDVVNLVAGLAPSMPVHSFWRDYVEGTQALDYTAYLGCAGLLLRSTTIEVASSGFSTTQNAAGLTEVDSVEPGSAAQAAGLRPGDVLVAVDGVPVASGVEFVPPEWRPHQRVEIQVSREGQIHELKFAIGTTRQISYHVEEDTQASQEQLRVRNGWLTGGTNPVAEGSLH